MVNGLFWKTLAPLEEPIKDPTVGTQFHQPTSDDVPVVEKINYSQTFDRAPFIGVSKVYKIDRFKKRKIYQAIVKFIQETMKIENGGPTSEYFRENNLDYASLPHEWFEAFLPSCMNSSWTKYTNTKALMQNSGIEGEIYPDFKPFILEYLRKHLGVYIVHGLSPTQEFNMKFQSQSEDNINGNDFVKRCIGPAAVRRHKHFRRFFCHSISTDNSTTK